MEGANEMWCHFLGGGHFVGLAEYEQNTHSANYPALD